MKRVLLLNLPSEIRCSRVLHRSNIGKPGYIWPPVDFLCLSGYLWEAGLSIDYKDFQIDGETSMWGHLKEKQYDVIISSYAPYFENKDLYLLRGIKKIYPNINIVLLANHNDRLDERHSERILRGNDFITAIIYNYVYNNVTSFLEGVRTDGIYNVFYLDNGNFQGRIKDIPEKVEIPIPRHEIFMSDSYFHYDSVGGYLTSSMSSFGCKKGCPFCWSNKLYPAVSVRTPENLVAEMEHVVSCGISEVYFHDLTFAYYREYILRFCNLMVERGIKLKWFCSSRFDLMDPEIIDAMGKAGCRCIEFGLESGNYKVRRLYGKDCSDETIRDVVSMCKKEGIHVSVFIILGLPEEKISDMKASLDFVKKMDFDYLALNFMWAEPLSDFGEKMQSDIIETPGTSAMQEVNFKHRYVSNGELKRFYRKSIRNFYLRPRFIVRQIAGIRSIKKIKNIISIMKGLVRKERL